jgi:hypothetical protein
VRVPKSQERLHTTLSYELVSLVKMKPLQRVTASQFSEKRVNLSRQICFMRKGLVRAKGHDSRVPMLVLPIPPLIDYGVLGIIFP